MNARATRTIPALSVAVNQVPSSWMHVRARSA